MGLSSVRSYALATYRFPFQQFALAAEDSPAARRASSSIFLVSSTFYLVGSSTASMRRMTHIGRITSGTLVV